MKLADFPTSLSALFGDGTVAAAIRSSLEELGAPDSPSSTLPDVVPGRRNVLPLDDRRETGLLLTMPAAGHADGP